ncbi:sugar transferase [Dyadobacter flavalbus]|uniref:Sugar transferase n=1 Tax=Dyadobacter flavalbus TaxID=2579942 RepID=A0A5M8QZM6_9BACT|nr:sugar transferase [Dyadobacter flavalbus]KAA6441745.1 sugar transferase [Dyadobacter flavalbus]
MYIRSGKRIFDIFIAAAGLIILLPLFILLAILLSFVHKGKPFFFQQRPGLNEKIFTMIKFRTINNTGKTGMQLASDASVTGNFLRKTSLDEIPQLWNVIRGEMSIVGPRPLLTEYLELYSEDQRRRHAVLPGITGWAQVQGRNHLAWEQKFEYDLWYVKNRSFKLDMKIVFMTITRVLRKEGINFSSGSHMDKFTG